MDPFRLACPHCSSKIIVRHEPLLGQTLPCPKCKGPIVVPTVAPPSNGQNTPVPNTLKTTSASVKSPATSRPQSGSRPSAPIVDSTAMTKVGDVDWNELLANEDLSKGSDSDGDAGLKFRTANEPDFIPIPPSYGPNAPSLVAATPTASSKPARQSNQLAKQRQWLTLATILVGGSLFAIIGFLAFMRAVGTKGKSTNEPIAVVEPKSTESPKTEIAATNEVTPAIESQPIESRPNESQPNVIEKTPDPVGGIGPPAVFDLANNNSEKREVTPTQANPMPPVVSKTPDGQQTPNGDEDVTLGSAFESSSLPDWLLGNDSNIPTITAQDNEMAELNIEDADVNRDQLFHREPSAVPSWDQKSKLSINSVQVKDINLLRCIDMFGRWAGVGITVDWESCRIAEIDLRKKVEINATNQSISDMMAQLLKENGLVWSLDQSGLPVISAPKTLLDAKIQLDWTVAGLFPTDSEKQGCESLLRLWGYDDVCKLENGKLQWSDHATPLERANLASSLYLLAKLRDQTWNQRDDSQSVFSPNVWNKSAAGFDRRIKSNVLAPEKRPIADLLTLAASETQLHLVIDWRQAWAHGLTPSESATVFLGGRSFPQVAKRFLNEYALEIMPIGEDTVLLTTREARRRQFRVVPLRLPKNFKVDDLKQSLRALAPVVDEESKFRILPIPGTEDLFFARICTPRVDQLSDPDIMLGLGWSDR